MKCCATCFGNNYLQSEVIKKISQVSGTCSYCSADGQSLVTPQELQDSFELLVSIYVHHDDGKPLLEWLREDWMLFKNPPMDDARATKLLADILEDSDIATRKVKPSARSNTDALDSWEKLRNELMYENRFFPETEFDVATLELLLSYLPTPERLLQVSWYRARLQDGSVPIPIHEMGAPPKNRSTHGRANPVGIPYLYLASAPTTAVAEIRPHTGEIATVARFSVQPKLEVVDLRNPREVISPFQFDEESQIEMLRGSIGLLDRLGEELTRPVSQQVAAIHYIPSQYLCEFIKKCGYDGVVYRSSVGDGMNLALFDPSLAIGHEVKQKKVTRVSVELHD